MASPLMSAYQLNSGEFKQEPNSPVKVCPDSTNNNTSSANNNNMATEQQTSVITSVPAPAPRGRGRKANPNAGFIQVIPGQPISVARRNARERNRVKQVNNGFSTLRQHIPFTARNKKLSKVETLRCAVEYIRSLQNLLIENGGYDAGLLDVDTGVTSSSPVSSLESGEEHSLLSMTGASETASFESQEPTQTMLLTFPEYEAPLRNPGVLQHHHHQRLYEPAAYEPPRQGSSLSPGYSDRSSASPATEVSTTGFMGVFAAAAGLKEERHDPEMLEALGWWDLHHEQQQRKQAV